MFVRTREELEEAAINRHPGIVGLDSRVNMGLTC